MPMSVLPFFLPWIFHYWLVVSFFCRREIISWVQFCNILFVRSLQVLLMITRLVSKSRCLVVGNATLSVCSACRERYVLVKLHGLQLVNARATTTKVPLILTRIAWQGSQVLHILGCQNCGSRLANNLSKLLLFLTQDFFFQQTNTLWNEEAPLCPFNHVS